MAFPESTKKRALTRARGRCECRRKTHKHPHVRCPTKLPTRNVQYHHKTAQSVGGGDALSNCEALCKSCHLGTRSYGRS